MEQRDTLPRLRGSLDSNDTFVSGGHGVIKTAGATSHAERMKRIPVWALDDQKIKQLVRRCFPGGKRRHLAERLVRILYLYYRVGSTGAAIAEQLKMTEKAVEDVIRRANRTANRPVKSRGRPKKNTEGVRTTSGDSGEDRITL